MKEFLIQSYEEANEWAQNRMWIPRFLLLAYLVWVFFQCLADSRYQGLVGGLNLGIHELGHFIFRPFGEFMMFLGGSLFQCLVPFGSIFMFFRQRDFFAIAVAFGWLSTNFFNVATYIADARTMALPLVTPGGGDAKHDWNWLLDHLGMLAWDQRFAFLVRVAAVVSMLICFIVGFWLVWKMFRLRQIEE